VPVIICGNAVMCEPCFQSARARRIAPHRRRRSALLALGRTFWRVLDDLDYRLTQARLWLVDVVYGPEAEDGG
jgi:hypothetical protein